ncbi:tRNA uridine-5-carboxymethylaminomethyl(34) synthesis enzyme MnmG [Selenomonas sp. TAMA-11512]|uniref:tRNA uridine-5-carboxymethylaminomethyl(34) synthesis enzyme MnmG n=1 Tax=Selenomonas sp. TAMA-11512 TaxID=3095337 RepID=UPI00308ED081|nr:tRNA uridine-5-carboxymethylaminomethyl(34) synthesis enzyme MnmG [Selenomonas sp. TAMA-11512]
MTQHSDTHYDIIVVGAGHAGVEAGLAAARMGKRVLLATISLDNVAFMPCNPSIGGPAKSHLVKEIDALGGEMGIAADLAAIQARLLNTGKGPAVHALRQQADKRLYQEIMKETVENTAGLDLRQLLIEELIIEDGAVRGVVTELGETFYAPVVILATGTYLQGRIIIGEKSYSSGPNGMRPALALTESLAKAGLKVMRFKTGTPARVDARTLDYSVMQLQEGDETPSAFSFMHAPKAHREVSCYLTYTNEETHQILRDNMERAPMANGLIEGTGPRYCPAIETKILRFPDKDKHQLFLEPEGLHTREIYVQGMSTSMPMDVQEAFLHTIRGMEACRIMRPGYAIEYDCLDPLELQPSLETKKVRGLFSAGQANGTSGYEEAAAQGLIAGINAVRKLDGAEPVVLGRADGYIGVLIDDLVTKGTTEPYRMMTSRAEWRLLLRQDNADLRLTPLGREIGLVSDVRWVRFCRKKAEIDAARAALAQTITPDTQTLERLEAAGFDVIRQAIPLGELLRREGVTYGDLFRAFGLPEISPEAAEEVEIEHRYAGYIEKQKEQVEKQRRLEAKRLSETIDYRSIASLRDEAKEKLATIRPRSVGQASRISGVSPADISVLLVYLEQQSRDKRNA